MGNAASFKSFEHQQGTARRLCGYGCHFLEASNAGSIENGVVRSGGKAFPSIKAGSIMMAFVRSSKQPWTNAISMVSQKSMYSAVYCCPLLSTAFILCEKSNINKHISSGCRNLLPSLTVYRAIGNPGCMSFGTSKPSLDKVCASSTMVRGELNPIMTTMPMLGQQYSVWRRQWHTLIAHMCNPLLF